MDEIVLTAGIILNILAFIWMIVSLKSIKYIRREDIYAYNQLGEPSAVKEGTTWDKAWHKPKLPIYLWILLVIIIEVPYLGAIVYIGIAGYTTDQYNESCYYTEKTKLRLKIEAVAAKIKKPFVFILNLLSKEI